MVRLLIESGAAVLPHHVEDAKAGTRGELQWVNTHRSLEDRARIERIVCERGGGGAG